MASSDMRLRSYSLALVLSCVHVGGARADYPAVFPYWPVMMNLNQWGAAIMMMPLAAPQFLLALPQQIPVLPVMPGAMMPLAPVTPMQADPWAMAPTLPAVGESQSWPPPLPPVPFLPVQADPVEMPAHSAPADEPPMAALAETGQSAVSPVPMIAVGGAQASALIANPDQTGAAKPADVTPKAKSKPRTRTKPKTTVTQGVPPPRKLCWNNGVVKECEKSALPKQTITK